MFKCWIDEIVLSSQCIYIRLSRVSAPLFQQLHSLLQFIWTACEAFVVSSQNKLEQIKSESRKTLPSMLLRTKAPGRAVSHGHNTFLSRQHSLTTTHTRPYRTLLDYRIP